MADDISVGAMGPPEDSLALVPVAPDSLANGGSGPLSVVTLETLGEDEKRSIVVKATNAVAAELNDQGEPLPYEPDAPVQCLWFQNGQKVAFGKLCASLKKLHMNSLRNIFTDPSNAYFQDNYGNQTFRSLQDLDNNIGGIHSSQLNLSQDFTLEKLVKIMETQLVRQNIRALVSGQAVNLDVMRMYGKNTKTPISFEKLFAANQGLKDALMPILPAEVHVAGWLDCIMERIVCGRLQPEVGDPEGPPKTTHTFGSVIRQFPTALALALGIFQDDCWRTPHTAIPPGGLKAICKTIRYPIQKRVFTADWLMNRFAELTSGRAHDIDELVVHAAFRVATDTDPQLAQVTLTVVVPSCNEDEFGSLLIGDFAQMVTYDHDLRPETFENLRPRHLTPKKANGSATCLNPCWFTPSAHWPPNRTMMTEAYSVMADGSTGGVPLTIEYEKHTGTPTSVQWCVHESYVDNNKGLNFFKKTDRQFNGMITLVPIITKEARLHIIPLLCRLVDPEVNSSKVMFCVPVPANDTEYYKNNYLKLTTDPAVDLLNIQAFCRKRLWFARCYDQAKVRLVGCLNEKSLTAAPIVVSEVLGRMSCEDLQNGSTRAAHILQKIYTQEQLIAKEMAANPAVGPQPQFGLSVETTAFLELVYNTRVQNDDQPHLKVLTTYARGFEENYELPNEAEVPSDDLYIQDYSSPAGVDEDQVMNASIHRMIEQTDIHLHIFPKWLEKVCNSHETHGVLNSSTLSTLWVEEVKAYMSSTDDFETGSTDYFHPRIFHMAFVGRNRFNTCKYTNTVETQHVTTVVRQEVGVVVDTTEQIARKKYEAECTKVLGQLYAQILKTGVTVQNAKAATNLQLQDTDIYELEEKVRVATAESRMLAAELKKKDAQHGLAVAKLTRKYDREKAVLIDELERQTNHTKMAVHLATDIMEKTGLSNNGPSPMDVDSSTAPTNADGAESEHTVSDSEGEPDSEDASSISDRKDELPSSPLPENPSSTALVETPSSNENGDEEVEVPVDASKGKPPRRGRSRDMTKNVEDKGKRVKRVVRKRNASSTALAETPSSNENGDEEVEVRVDASKGKPPRRGPKRKAPKQGGRGKSKKRRRSSK